MAGHSRYNPHDLTWRKRGRNGDWRKSAYFAFCAIGLFKGSGSSYYPFKSCVTSLDFPPDASATEARNSHTY